MSSKKTSALVIAKTDYLRLMQLIEKNGTDAADALDLEISRAKIVDDTKLPVDVVAMNTKVTFSDLDSAEEKTIQLVYPQDADVTQLKISVLSPVGSALIGLKIGGTIEWPIPSGKVRRLKVIAVEQQPE
ncbi:nucleoside diphosphate kinase regulator [Cellvibrio sp. PSBB023]|uniref:nucleoside diphosphate kinase regulator n=1 Tax=Cellvibrio sp. PSBB023 TaxID=1945512 RepID=UPI00098EABA5|nr:nucleoside diphosphate kinase regulator [Cellvibrio sp. PSBB023]AQT58787.1 nucleoside diphosphate kinase regulator [Cellvibrio sp. PSBB023]